MSGTARTGGQDFASLLKQSKVLQLTTKQPVALTSHGGYLARGDFGLKRPLPRAAVGKTPYIRLSTGIDGSDFISSAKQALFASRWDESGLVAGSPNSTKRLIDSSPFDKASWDRVVPSSSNPGARNEKPEAVDAQEQERIFDTIMTAQESHQPVQFEPPLSAAGQAFYDSIQQDDLLVASHKMPELGAMSDKEFNAFITHLESLPPAFKSFLERRMSQRLAAAPIRRSKQKLPPSEQLASSSQPEASQTSQARPTADLLEQAQESSSRSSAPDFLDFLTTAPAVTGASRSGYIPPQPHPLGALNYVPFNAMQRVWLQRPLPARYIEAARGRKQSRDDHVATALGATASVERVNDVEQGLTQFLPPLDANNQRVPQSRNKAAGFGLAEVTESKVDESNDRQVTDEANDAHDEYYGYEKRLSELSHFQQLIKQAQPEGPPAKPPYLRIKLLKQQEAKKYVVGAGEQSSGIPRSRLLARSLGGQEYVRGPTDQEIEETIQQLTQDHVSDGLKEILDSAPGIRKGSKGQPKGKGGKTKRAYANARQQRWT